MQAFLATIARIPLLDVPPVRQRGFSRDDAGSNAEVDYVIQFRGHVVPIEVKAGTTGTLKSLHLLMGLRKLRFAVRVNSDVPSITDVNVKNSLGTTVQYRLLSIPFYLIGQLYRFILELDHGDI